MDMNLFNFKKQLEDIASKRARHTELISVYIPPGYEMSKIINQLKEEQGTASNIKSSSTKKNVQTALERMIQHLRLFDKVPEHGLAIFSGNISEREGADDFQVYAIIPPYPLKNKTYLCEQKFFLEPLWEMTQPLEVYGLIILERGGGTIGLLKGSRIEVVKDEKSMVPGKSRAGGQSSVRYAHVRENLTNDFYKKVGADASQIFLGTANLKGVILGGAGPAKEEFADGDFMHHELKKKIIGVRDVGYDGEEGLRELVERSKDLLHEASITREIEVVKQLLSRLGRGEPVAYGEAEVRRAIESSAVDILLLSAGLAKNRVTLECQNCHATEERTVGDINQFTPQLKNEKHSCGGSWRIVKSEDVIKNLAEAAHLAGATVELISMDTPEGNQLLQLSGIAAMLKFRLQ